MVSMVILESKENEIDALKLIIKELAAKLTDDKWKIEFLQSVQDINRVLSQRPLIDLSCYDITLDGALEKLIEFRKCYEETGLLLITDSGISPVLYLRPGIRADSMLMRPLKKEVVYETLQEFISSYLEKQNKEHNEKSYVIEGKEGRIILPYKDIFYLEAREKKIFLRTLNSEYGFYSTIEQLEEVLPDTFIRCHRSYIVNTAKIEKIMLSQNQISLAHGFTVPLSRSYKPILKQYGK